MQFFCRRKGSWALPEARRRGGAAMKNFLKFF